MDGLLDATYWIEEKTCPACGSEKFTYQGFGMVPMIQFPEIFHNCPLGVITTYSLCGECGLVFQNPHLEQNSINEFYASGVYRKVINDPNNRMDIDENTNQARRADLIPAGGKLLDIGCSHGVMLELARMKGCDILGVEPNRSYVNFGVPSVASLYEVEGQWDTVTCFHVLEHVPELKRFVDKMVELVKPGGRLLLEVPKEGENGASHRLQHLYLFSPEVIRKLFGALEFVNYMTTPHHFFEFRKAPDAE